MDISALVIDFSRVLIFAKVDVPSLNQHHAELEAQPGYRVLDHFELNTELLEYLRVLSGRVPVYLFSDGKLHTLPEIAPALKGIFRAIYTADEVGYKKSQPEAYLALAMRMGLTPGQVLFIDDSESNVAAAISSGLRAIQYTDNAQIIGRLDAASAPSR